MKRLIKIIPLALVVIAVIFCFTTPIFGAPGDWNLDGNWVIDFTKVPGGDTYSHDMVVSGATATGGWEAGSGPIYTNYWGATVSVIGNQVDIVAPYLSTSAVFPYLLTFTGEIAPGGTMSGTWFDSKGNSGTWISTSGAATLIEDTPPTKAENLMKSGVPGKGLADAPGLQKPFNPKSQAGEKAGKK